MKIQYDFKNTVKLHNYSPENPYLGSKLMHFGFWDHYIICLNGKLLTTFQNTMLLHVMINISNKTTMQLQKHILITSLYML